MSSLSPSDSASSLYLLPAWPQDYITQAHARAIVKAEKAYGEGPIPRDSRLLAKGAVSTLVAVVSFWVWAIEDNYVILGLISLAGFAGNAVFWICRYATSSNPNPEHAVRRWLEGAASKRAERLFAHVTAYDRDELPRYTPATNQPGPPLNSGDAASSYWRLALERFGVVGGRLWPRTLSCKLLTPRIALVEGEVFAHNPGLRPWKAVVGVILAAGLNLLIAAQFPQELRGVVVVVGSVALVASLWVLIQRKKRTVRLRLQKVVVRSGPAWRVLSGEWCGPEDHDLTWVRDAVQVSPGGG
ncbi:MAG: hypothetical protein KF754_02700 [Planctomycetes bacterium]|nr:hypothetical protein [Planctomycetota bacterium]